LKNISFATKGFGKILKIILCNNTSRLFSLRCIRYNLRLTQTIRYLWFINFIKLRLILMPKLLLLHLLAFKLVFKLLKILQDLWNVFLPFVFLCSIVIFLGLLRSKSVRSIIFEILRSFQFQSIRLRWILTIIVIHVIVNLILVKLVISIVHCYHVQILELDIVRCKVNRNFVIVEASTSYNVSWLKFGMIVLWVLSNSDLRLLFVVETVSMMHLVRIQGCFHLLSCFLNL